MDAPVVWSREHLTAPSFYRVDSFARTNYFYKINQTQGIQYEESKEGARDENPSGGRSRVIPVAKLAEAPLSHGLQFQFSSSLIPRVEKFPARTGHQPEASRFWPARIY